MSMRCVEVFGAVCVLVFHLRLALSAHGEEMCSNPTINYRIQTYTFLPNTTAYLECAISSPVQWWTSTDPCGAFVQSPFCQDTGSNICTFNVTLIANHFYHCCTSGGRVVNSLSEVQDSGNCVRVELCTAIIEDSVYQPPYSYFGETLLIYIQVYSHPPPNQTHRAFLLTESPNGTQLGESQVSVRQPSLTTPIFSFQYSILIPFQEEVQQAIVSLAIQFVGVCSGKTPSQSVQVRVISRENTDVITMPPASLPVAPTTEGVQSQEECSTNTGLLPATVVPAVLLIAVIVMMLGIIVYLVHLLRRLKKESSVDISSSNPARPTSLDTQSYLRLSSHDQQTPSPAVQYMNCPQDRPNGNHLQPGQVTTPNPQSSIALGYSQRSHTGRTPLMAPTPDTDQPFPTAATAPPSYGQTVGAAYNETVQHGRLNGRSKGTSNHEYAAVGGVGGSQQRGRGTSPVEMGGAGIPIYSNTTISELANDVQLQGADVANQTDV